MLQKSTDADDRILYNTTNGALYYDTDGTGEQLAIQFATIENLAVLTKMDFWQV